MAIRLRDIDGLLVALCAAETDAEEGDVYLDDVTHHALAVKFARDWRGETVTWTHPRDDAAAEKQKLRDAEGAHNDWMQGISHG